MRVVDAPLVIDMSPPALKTIVVEAETETSPVAASTATLFPDLTFTSVFASTSTDCEEETI